MRTQEMTIDDLYPRDERERYRIYAVRGDEREILATAADAGGVGQALITMHEDCKEVDMRLADLGTIGVLDAVEGEWVVLPWGRKEQT